MYSSYLTRETFENEHDEKMTRKFSYNYQVLKRLFPEVYKLPESEIRSLVHSIYDNPKLGDELLDHLSDVINKKKPEWGEYLNPKPEEPEQPIQDNPLQPVQPKPLNTSLGFEPYKPQKSAFGLGNSGSFGGLNNTNNFGNTGGLNGLNTTGGLKQSQLPNFSKGMDLKHSDMVTGFGINEAKQKEMFGTGFSMPKLPKLPQFPKAPEPQMPKMSEILQKLQAQPKPQYKQTELMPQFQQTQISYFPQSLDWRAYADYKKWHDKLLCPIITYNFQPNDIPYIFNQRDKDRQVWQAISYMANEYCKMKGHNYTNLDNYHHCKANYAATKFGKYGEEIAQNLAREKEIFDYFWNIFYKGLTRSEAYNDYINDTIVNLTGNARANFGLDLTPAEACADFREKQPRLPEHFW